MAMTIETYVREVTRVYEQFLGRVQQLSVTELEDDVRMMLAHIVRDDCLAEASVTMLPLHYYRLCKLTCSTGNVRWFGDFLDLVLARIDHEPIEDRSDFYASCESPAMLDRVGLCAAAFVHYNENNPSKKEEA